MYLKYYLSCEVVLLLVNLFCQMLERQCYCEKSD